MTSKVTRLIIGLILVGSVWQSANYCIADEPYEPGPVVGLHTWLGDQCSFVPDFDIGECCAVHDLDYQTGGNEFQRWRVDVKFRNCIRNEGRPIVAVIYYWGVRSFGWLFFNYN